MKKINKNKEDVLNLMTGILPEVIFDNVENCSKYINNLNINNYKIIVIGHSFPNSIEIELERPSIKLLTDHCLKINNSLKKYKIEKMIKYFDNDIRSLFQWANMPYMDLNNNLSFSDKIKQLEGSTYKIASQIHGNVYNEEAIEYLSKGDTLSENFSYYSILCAKPYYEELVKKGSSWSKQIQSQVKFKKRVEFCREHNILFTNNKVLWEMQFNNTKLYKT